MLEGVEVAVAVTLAAAAAVLDVVMAGAAAAAEAAIRIQYYVALLFIPKVLNREVLVLLYMED
jgi:hypothetical protein